MILHTDTGPTCTPNQSPTACRPFDLKARMELRMTRLTYTPRSKAVCDRLHCAAIQSTLSSALPDGSCPSNNFCYSPCHKSQWKHRGYRWVAHPRDACRGILSTSKKGQRVKTDVLHATQIGPPRSKTVRHEKLIPCV